MSLIVILHRVNTLQCFFLYSTGYATSYYGISVANGVDVGNVASIQLQLVQLYFILLSQSSLTLSFFLSLFPQVGAVGYFLGGSAVRF